MHALVWVFFMHLYALIITNNFNYHGHGGRLSNSMIFIDSRYNLTEYAHSMLEIFIYILNTKHNTTQIKSLLRQSVKLKIFIRLFSFV